jgi:lipoprotein NlpD
MFAWPLHGIVTAPFVVGKANSIMIEGKTGDSVTAAAAGRVVYAGGRIAAYGQLIIIKHNAHFITAYGNNGKLLIKEGTVVTRCQKIAKLSLTDNASVLPVSFQARDNGEPVNPMMLQPGQPDASDGARAFN